MCFVRGPASNRSAKEFAVELSLCISTFIGVSRSMYTDLKDSPNSSSEEWIQNSQCDCQSEPPRAFSRDCGSPAKSLSTKTVILSTCSSLPNLNAALVSQPDIALHVPAEESRKHEVHSFSGPNASRCLQSLIGLGKVSCTQICIVHLLSSKSDSICRRTPTCLVVHSLSWCSRCIQIH